MSLQSTTTEVEYEAAAAEAWAGIISNVQWGDSIIFIYQCQVHWHLHSPPPLIPLLFGHCPWWPSNQKGSEAELKESSFEQKSAEATPKKYERHLRFLKKTTLHTMMTEQKNTDWYSAFLWKKFMNKKPLRRPGLTTPLIRKKCPS